MATLRRRQGLLEAAQRRERRRAPRPPVRPGGAATQVGRQVDLVRVRVRVRARVRVRVRLRRSVAR